MASEPTKPPEALPPDVELVLRPLSYGHAASVPTEVRLRKLLKAALRAYGFRCVSVKTKPRWEMNRQAFADEAAAARKAG